MHVPRFGNGQPYETLIRMPGVRYPKGSVFTNDRLVRVPVSEAGAKARVLLNHNVFNCIDPSFKPLKMTDVTWL